MIINLKYLTVIMIVAPLLGAIAAGLAGRRIGRKGAHTVTIVGMIISFLAALAIAQQVFLAHQTFYGSLYTWGQSGRFQFDIGFMIDPLTALMAVMVTFISLIVHIYSVGYMAEDSGYQRFFSYVSLFTFAMLLLITANNFFQLFLGWEGVGLASYLLIGFWFTKESAAQGSLKAFLVNRVGDFGFLLGIAALLDYVGSIDYHVVFQHAPSLVHQTITLLPHSSFAILTVICVLLFVGAMGKSAQVPLHVWLPESMEGPTPISALIHAATMVTAGVFMIARMAPLFSLSPAALSLVLVVGATGALFLGLLAFVENDIKRVIAYSTMSQLGYMMAANGVMAFSAGIFHLLTHAGFKALLFLAAGSVIIALHHEQDLRKMGGLRKYLPWTCFAFLIGALALSAIPPFSGFYSKDMIVEAVHRATIPGAHYAYFCLLFGAFVTAYYIFRAYFMAFHAPERMDEKVRAHLHETSWMIRGPLLVLVIPSIFLGALWVYPHAGKLMMLAWQSPTFWFSVAGIAMAWWTVIVMPIIPTWLARHLPFLHRILIAKYGFDAFNQFFFVRGTQKLSRFFYRYADLKLIDYFMVEGSGRNVSRIAKLLKRFQSGYLYHYVFVMILGLLGFLLWLLVVK